MAKLSFKTLITRARATAPLPQAEVALSREAAEIELGVAEAAFEAAQIAYRAGLIDADVDTLKQLAQAQADAGLRRDRARALVDRFDAQLAEIRVAEELAREAERQAELERIIGSADATLAELREAVERDCPLIIEAVRNFVDLAGAAERARATAIRALQSAGDERMPATVENFRGIAGRPEKTLSVETVELWVDERGDPVGFQEQIVVSSDGTGWLKLPNAVHGRRFTHRRRFERTQYLPALPARHAVSLASVLPEIAAAVGKLEMPTETPEAERQRQVRLKPAGDMVDVVAMRKASNAAGRAEKDLMLDTEMLSQARLDRIAMGHGGA